MLIRCCMCVGGSMGMVSNCMGIFFSPLANSLNTGVGRISIVVTIVSLFNAFFAPFFVKLRQRFPLNYLMGFGALLCACATCIMSFARNVFLLYICGVLNGIGMCCFAILPVTLVLKSWYGEKNGTALGTALAFSGIFGAIMNPVYSRLITMFNYQVGLRTMAAILALVIFPCAFTIRLNPEDNQESVQSNKETDKKVVALASSLFILLVIMCILVNGEAAMNQHFSAFAISNGYSLEQSATVVTAVMIGNVIFKIMYGFLSDRMNPILASIIFAIVGGVGTLLVLFFALNPLLIRLGAMFYGAYFSLNTAAISMITQYVAKESYAETYAKLMVFSSSAYAIGVSVFGLLYDALGSYRLPLVLILIFTVCVIFVYLTLMKKTNNKNDNSVTI